VKARRRLLAALRQLDVGDILMAKASIVGAISALAEPIRARGERIEYPPHAGPEPAPARDHLTRALAALKTNRRVALTEAGRALDALMQPVRDGVSRRS
jgi:hypothetical protein